MALRLGRVYGFAMLVATVGVFSPPRALAQGGRSEIRGTVLDQAKAVLPGATVTATNEGTGIARTVTSGEDGRFTIPTLVPGVYTLRAELTGFQPQARTGVVLAVGQELTFELTLPVGVAETITVTGATPVVEVTTSRIGANISGAEIDNLPSQGRSAVSLMQTLPGLTPALNPGSFEGDNFNANGRATNSNLFLVDGIYNNDERNGGSNAQARISLDTLSEFQVLTHQYTAEFGGSSGVVVNSVTKSGQNRVFGRGFYYLQDDTLTATDPFLKALGESNPDSGQKSYGFNAGGPFVKNKAFWFFNLERNVIDEAVQLDFPAEAASIAQDINDTQKIRSLNTFLRTDYTISGNQSVGFRWTREATPSIGEDWETNRSTRDNIFIEKDAGDQNFNSTWTAIIGNRATNEAKFAHVRESVLQGNTQYFDNLEDLNFIELNGREQFDVGSQNTHPDYTAGPRASHGTAKGRTYVVSDDFTFVKSGWAGNHTFKAGASHSWVLVRPQIAGGNDNGTFTFLGNRPYNPADPFSYPVRFAIRLGQIYFNLEDKRTASYVQDKWQVGRVTFNAGLRYDYQTLTPETKNAFAPRFGVAFDPTGTGRTVIRGGIGKFYEYILAGVHGVLQQQAVIGPSQIFDTGQDISATRGVIPAAVCLQPSNSGGLAVISPACRASLTTVRSNVTAGGFANFEPTVDGDRRMGYLWSFSAGVQHELMRNLGVTVDYIGNRGRDQTGLIDINEGSIGANGLITRRGVNVFDPTGALVPASARGTNFRRVLQYQTLDALNTDYNALELSLDKRYSNRWSGRFSYTLAKAQDVAGTGPGTRYTEDLNPRLDYGRANIDNRHAFTFSLNTQVWKGLGAGGVFRHYSGYPINETVGLDTNGDNDATDRPVRGVHDLTRPILSPVDGTGRAIRNGIQGNGVTLLDLRLQYIVDMPTRQNVGFFLEVYNALNEANLGNPTGNRNQALFMVPTVAGDMRTAQLGVRYTF
jgi:hypothetical protein